MTTENDLPSSPLPLGKADSTESSTTAWDGHVCAILWLPDPEQRHGWREFYVRESTPPKPGGKMGFRRES